jgi:hypothetical protein
VPNNHSEFEETYRQDCSGKHDDRLEDFCSKTQKVGGTEKERKYGADWYYLINRWLSQLRRAPHGILNLAPYGLVFPHYGFLCLLRERVSR